MLRKTMMALLATAALIALAPQSAFARGGHGGFGAFHGGGGGWHGGGVAAFRGAPIGGGVAFRQAAVVGGPHVVGGFHPGFHPGFRRGAFIAGAVAGAAYAAPYGYGYYDNYDGPIGIGAMGGGVGNGSFGIDVRNADGLIVTGDMTTGFWAFKMDGFDGWNGHQWGMPNNSSAQDWDNGPDGLRKAPKVSTR